MVWNYILYATIGCDISTFVNLKTNVLYFQTIKHILLNKVISTEQNEHLAMKGCLTDQVLQKQACFAEHS